MGTVKYSGPIASFHCPTEATIRSLKVHFSPKQEGSGTPSPENIREIVGWDGVEVEQRGKNLFDASNPNIISRNCWVSSNTPHNIIASNVDRTVYINCLPNMTYVISKTLGNVLGAGYTTELPVIGIPTYSYMRDNYAKQVIVTTGADAKYLAIWFYDASKTFDKTVQPEDIYKTLQVEIGSTATSYEPYHGSTTNYEFGVLGKNKLNVGTIQFNHYKQYRLNDNPIPPGTYTLSANVVSNDTDADKSYVLFRSGSSSMLIEDGATLVRNIKDNKTVTFRNPITEITFYAGTTYANSVGDTATWSEVQLELGSTATAYEPYNPNHTVYGGWVDLISGEVCEEQLIWTVDDINFVGGNPDSYNEESGKRFSASWSVGSANDFSDDINTVAKCNILPTVGTTNSSSNAKAINWLSVYKGWGSNTIYGCLSDSVLNNDTSIDNIKAYLKSNDFKVLIKLAIPNIYNLPPYSAELKTFLSQNNVWSNADYVEIEYDLHETQDILARKQFIIANQPHVVKPAAAPLQNFVTDMAAALKECKVEFKPVQDLHGYNKPWVGGSGKNLLPDTYDEDEFFSLYLTSGTDVCCSANLGSVGANMVYYYRQDKTLINSYALTETYDTNRRYRTFRLSEDAYYWKFNMTGSNFQVELGSTATSYEPYENVCPINGWNGATVNLAGKNIASKSFQVIGKGTSYGGSYGGKGRFSNDVKHGFIVFPVPQGSTVTVSCKNYDKYWVDRGIAIKLDSLSVENNQYIGYRNYVWYYSVERRLTTQTIQIPNGADGLLISFRHVDQETPITQELVDKLEFSCVIGTEDISTYEPYQGTTVPIDWTTEAGTVYGGYVDLVMGEVWATWIRRDLSAFSTTNAPTGASEPWNHIWTLGQWTSSGWEKKNGVTNLMSDILEVKTNPSANYQTIGVSNTYPVYVYDSEVSTAAEFKAKYAGHYIAYELRNPTLVITLTPTQLKSLRGTNNVWSNANGGITVQFWKH